MELNFEPLLKEATKALENALKNGDSAAAVHFMSVLQGLLYHCGPQEEIEPFEFSFGRAN